MKNGDFAGSCMPFGWIRSFHPHPMQIVQNNEYITFLFEQSTMFQLVNTEGLPHRKDWPPSWFGDSRGRWEGDKLVIDVVNLNGYATLGTIGHPTSDQAHLTMTFERPDMGRILFNWVLEDPKTYTRPIRNERVFVYSPNVELMEYACMENNMQSLLDGAITPWVGQPNHAAERRARAVGVDLFRSDQVADLHGRRERSDVGERQARNGESRRQRNGRTTFSSACRFAWISEEWPRRMSRPGRR